ncbi:fumarase, class I, homodimeric [Arthrobacter subterraneus]|uniref:Fumarate hydratase class I n=1 Tax=Arthrobacter subterraneus TaxID=335973 RepID=A0A1G8HT00_9MICC|nr:FumA C-terminus/TtdB family hydratase beta subunit [Arthrobacter subterraneus]SDI09787.1 fumarase, class I, homodimeric [Arthrobacter subterraneus]
MADARFNYTDLLPRRRGEQPMRLLSTAGVSIQGTGADAVLNIDPEALEHLASEAFRDVSHFLRTDHLEQLRAILEDPESSANDRYVALDLLRNANVAAGGVLPMCQDTGTAIVSAYRGHRIRTDGDDARHLSRGIHRTFQELNLRYSQMAPLTMWEEANTGTNLPAQIEISLGKGMEYEFLFLAKGGGSANKSFLFQETKAVLDEDRMLEFLREKIESIGTAACPPYHLAVVVGGTSGEFALKTAKLASAHYLDTLPDHGGPEGHGYRDHAFEAKVFELTTQIGFGAQFGGKYFCHDVRVVRLPRHGGSLPVAIAVSCSADRQIIGRITAEGVFLEELERDPAQFLPDTAPDADEDDSAVTPIDLNAPMAAITKQLAACPVGSRVSLSGTMVVARDIAHAQIRARIERGEGIPQYLLDHPVYYAGPAKTPEGWASGSFGPTTAGRMDAYVEQFQSLGGSLVMLAKGNRSPAVADACARYGGYYLGSVGGPAARLAQDCIRSVEVIDYAELGMEAVFRIEVEDFPAFVLVDAQGNDFFAKADRTVVGLGPTRLAGHSN